MNDTIIGKAKKPARRNEQRKVVNLSPELLEFINSPVSTSEIAARYGISPSTLTVRAKRAGLPLRNRGRHPMKEPTPVQKKILAVAAIYGCQGAALRFDMSKQRVNKLQHRWKEWQAINTNCGSKTATRRNSDQHTVRFRLDSDSFNQLKKVLQHPWFNRLESTNQAAREIVNTFLFGGTRSLKLSRVVTP
jgi:hypothetical protein